jgi:CubicO group peptidase (beta-lactamase class C family)
LVSLLLPLLLLSFHGCGRFGSRSRDLATVDPQRAGWSTEKLEEAAEYAESIGSAAVVALHKGGVFFSWGHTEKKYLVHSIRKPLLGALYGIYVERGLIDLDQTLDELGIDDLPPSLTPEEKRATIRDLLMSRSGVYHEAAAEAKVMVETRPERGSHAPGTFFYYNNWDFNALGTIFEQIAGMSVFEAFAEEIAEPIGMQDFAIWDCYHHFEAKSRHPAYHFRMTARDMARFGLLYANGGKWRGRQIVPQNWIRESTRAYSINNLNGDGYGYLWSVIDESMEFGRGFYHTGIGVHLLAILTDRDVVLVHRVDVSEPSDIRWRDIRRLMSMILEAQHE